MPDSERQLGVIKDILLPLDKSTRYDVYFTDKRIAIVCMGHSRHVDDGVVPSRSFLFGIAPEALPSEQKRNPQTIDEEINSFSLDEKLKLSKKSCFYTYDEIEGAKMILGPKPKFIILSKECESKFIPDEEQFKQLCEILPKIDALRSKFSIAGNWHLLQEIFTASFK